MSVLRQREKAFSQALIGFTSDIKREREGAEREREGGKREREREKDRERGGKREREGGKEREREHVGKNWRRIFFKIVKRF